MSKTRKNSNFVFWLCINMLLNWKGLIPAVILFALHIWLNISRWWWILAVALWILWIILWMVIIGRAGKCGKASSPLQENKNPYSVRKHQSKE